MHENQAFLEFLKRQDFPAQNHGKVRIAAGIGVAPCLGAVQIGQDDALAAQHLSQSLNLMFRERNPRRFHEASLGKPFPHDKAQIGIISCVGSDRLQGFDHPRLGLIVVTAQVIPWT